MTAEVIVFPDLVAALVPYLQSRLTARGRSATVAYSIPNPRPTSLVRVSYAGGARLNIRHQQVRILVESWNSSEPAAYALAALCSAEIEAASRSQMPINPGVWIAAEPEDFSVPVNNPDPLTSSPRYQFICNLVLTGSAT